MRHDILLSAAVLALAGTSEPSPAEETATALEAVVETDAGSFTVRLLAGLAPRHVEHFASVAREGGFDGTTFHRIIPGGIIQGGDPLSKDPTQAQLYGTGGLGLLEAEFSNRPMTRGSLAAVLQPGRPNSGGNQFFICIGDQLALTGQYTIYGEIVRGMDVVDRIGETPVSGDEPEQRVEIRSVEIRERAKPESDGASSR